MFKKNQAQEEAVATHEGQLLLISCPGSGKTTTMIRRIHAMVEAGIKDTEIVMVTFTDASANEMKQRYAREYGTCGATFCTIHSLCLRILKEYTADRINVIPVEKQYDIARQCFRRAKIIFKSSDSLKNALTDVSAFKNSNTTLLAFQPVSMEKAQFHIFFNLYETMKQESGFIDFDDMLCRCRALLQKNENVLCALQKRYRYLMCDEYQDTNAVQKDILYLLAGKDGNLCVVGDDDQSIYGFRGATPGIMLTFAKDFPKAKAISMDTNYRSRPEIIRYAKNLIGHNKERFKKDIKASRDGVGAVKFETLNTRSEELSWVAKQIHTLISSGVNPNNIAVLTRTNLQLEDIASALDDEKIVYTAGEAIRDDYEHFIFRDLISYLTLMDGNWNKENFFRILNRPTRWLKDSLFAGVNGYDLDEMVAAASKHLPYEKKAIIEVKRLHHVLTAYQRATLAAKVHAILEEANYRSFVCDYADNTGSEAAIYFSKLDFFIREAKKYNTVDEWLAAARQHVAIHRNKMRQKPEQAVTLATMHRSKGLEWEYVFILDCCQNVMPGKLPVGSKTTNKSSEKTLGEIEEERRLFYVAMTRAKESLYLCNYSYREEKDRKFRSDASMVSVTPSVFLTEAKRDLEEIEKREKEAKEKREKDVRAIYNGFKEGSPLYFKVGMEVHHSEYGDGIVTNKTFSFVRIRFANEIKTFFL